MNLIFYFIGLFVLVFLIEKWELLESKSESNAKPLLTLEDWLAQFEWGKWDQEVSSASLPVYKFYTHLIELILKFARLYGGKYQDSFLLIKNCLRHDRQFEKKIKELIYSSLIQIFIIILITWGFIGAALHLSQVEVDLYKLLVIFIWQILGISLLPLGIRYFRTKYFRDISILWRFFHSLNCLISIPIARSELFKIAGIQDLKSVKQEALKFLVKKSFSMSEEVIKKGKSFDESVHSMMDELKFIEKWHFELFEKKIGVMKLVILALFLLPSYLVFIFFILQHLMRLM